MRSATVSERCRPPVQPIAIRYLPPDHGDDGHHPRAPWVDDAPLFGHFLEIVRLPRLEVTVTFCEPISGAGRDRRGLAEECRRAIIAALLHP